MALMDQYLYLVLHNCILRPMLSTSCHLLKKLQKKYAEAASISQVIPLVRAFTKVFEKEVEDTGVHSMQNKMLDSRGGAIRQVGQVTFNELCYKVK